jgi:hypothetical protein
VRCLEIKEMTKEGFDKMIKDFWEGINNACDYI